MDEPKVTALAPDGFAFVRAIEVEVEKRIVITRKVVPRPRCEFLIGGHKWGSNIVGKEISLCGRMQELNDIPMAHDSTAASFGECFSRDNLPPVVLVCVSITCDLLTYKDIRPTNMT